jgi:hypothetical protein
MYLCMVFFVLGEEMLEVGVDGVKECVYLLET